MYVSCLSLKMKDEITENREGDACISLILSALRIYLLCCKHSFYKLNQDNLY